MKKNITAIAVFLLGIASASFMSKVLGEESAPAPLYVDARAIKERFSTITEADMDMLRSKKILFCSASYGGNTMNGLRELAKGDKKYDMMSSFVSYKCGSGRPDTIPSLADFPPDAFSQHHFVHFYITIYPPTKRIDEMDELLRNPKQHFGDVVDVAFVYYDNCTNASAFDNYAKKMDALQKDFPKVRFIYCTPGFAGPKYEKNNEQGFLFGEKVRVRYKGHAPLFDMQKILSDDFRVGHVFCPEYSDDPANLHPNLPGGINILAKGFLLVLRDALKAQPASVNQFKPIISVATAAAKNESLPANHPDAVAVRAILNANGMTNKKVEDVVMVEGGRVVKLDIHECGLTVIPSAIGALTELKDLEVFGDRTLSYPYLKTIDPAIGNCTKLEQIVMTHNDVSTLPDTIVKLTNIKFLSLADNRLHDLAPAVKAWATRFDAKGLSEQR